MAPIMKKLIVVRIGIIDISRNQMQGDYAGLMDMMSVCLISCWKSLKLILPPVKCVFSENEVFGYCRVELVLLSETILTKSYKMTATFYPKMAATFSRG